LARLGRELSPLAEGCLLGQGCRRSALQSRARFDMPEKQRRVLVVDDQPAVRELVEALLRHSGHLVVTAESGPEALGKLDCHQFDVVFTDFLMPGMNGTELAREIKKRIPQLPVVLITGQQLERVSPDIALVLEKPFSRDDLKQAIGALT
jgi:CheY-like chemotaxis protein